MSKYITTLILALLIANISIAQTVESYRYSYSPTLLTTGGKIFVKDFSNKGELEPSFGEIYSQNLKIALNTSKRGLSSDYKLFNTWLTTKFYEVVENEEDADYVVSGEYVFSTSNSNSATENVITETSTMVKVKVPVHYFDYSETASASLNMNMYISKKGNTEALKQFPFVDSKNSSKTKALEKPDVPSSSSFMSTLSNAALSKYQYEFTPSFVPTKFKFNTVKPDNKDLKKAYKDKKESLKAFAESGAIAEMGKIYLEMLNDQDDSDIHSNLGMCYELIGNFTKAKEEYIKAGDKSNIEQILYLIKVRDTHTAMGIEVVENEF